MKQKSTLKAKTPLKAKVSLKANPKPKKRKGSTVAKLKKKADAVHSQVVRQSEADKDGMVKCFTCPNIKHYKQMQCGHFMSRQHNSTRYDFKNTAPQCYGCNVMHQGKQYEFGYMLNQKYGDDTAAAMYAKSKIPHQFTTAELEAIIADREARL